MNKDFKLESSESLNWFELFGYDVMIDEKFNVYLIEVNTNPCLETPCSLLSSIISSVLDDTFKLTLDVLFPPLQKSTGKQFFTKKIGSEIRFHLSRFEEIYNERKENNKVEILN